MKRTYADTSNFRAPFDPVALQGIGAVHRSYEDVSNFRAPYDDGYYQSGSLRGLGTAPLLLGPAHVPTPEQAPPAMRAYLQSGRPMGTLRRDLGSALNQVPQWVYIALGAAGLYFAYQAYKKSATRSEPATKRSAELAANARHKRKSSRRQRR